MAFLGLLTALSLVCSTYAAHIARQSSILNSSMTQRLEPGSPPNTIDLLVNETKPAPFPLVSSALLASNLSAGPHQPSSEYQLLPEANGAYECDRSFGQNLRRTSCSDAILRIDVNDKVRRVAQRGRSIFALAYLPLRWLSRKSSPTDSITCRE